MKLKRPLSSITQSDLPRRLLFLDLETRGGLRNFDQIELLAGGAIECVRTGKYAFRQEHYEMWTSDQYADLQDRLQKFDGLIVGMNLYGYDYRVLSRYFDVGPLISKTLDFQYELWRSGSGAVSLETLAIHNTRRRKVAGADMAGIWDKGGQAYVLKRNRVDCELTSQLYWHFINTGCLNTSYGGSFNFDTHWLNDDMNGPEQQLIFAGLMARFSADEWRWRIQHHNGIRGHRRFKGLPWLQHPDHEPDRPELYFSATCPDCKSDTLVFGPDTKSLDEWLTQLHCPNCAASYGQPLRSAYIYPGNSLYEEKSWSHQNYQEWRKQRDPKYRVVPLPKRFHRDSNDLSSFHFISPVTPGKLVPFTPKVRERRNYEVSEAQARHEIGRTSMRNRWNRWHPSWDFWRSCQLNESDETTTPCSP